jgi:hypothetical protein
MGDQDKQELAELQKMFDSEGWRVFVRHSQERLDAMKVQGWASIKSMEQLWYAKGAMETLENLIAHDKYVAALAEQQDLPLE